MPSSNVKLYHNHSLLNFFFKYFIPNFSVCQDSQATVTSGTIRSLEREPGICLPQSSTLDGRPEKRYCSFVIIAPPDNRVQISCSITYSIQDSISVSENEFLKDFVKKYLCNNLLFIYLSLFRSKERWILYPRSQWRIEFTLPWVIQLTWQVVTMNRIGLNAIGRWYPRWRRPILNVLCF
jgi:hypothetical protein